MDYNHFFNFYGYETQDGWTGRETQLKAARYDDSKVENTFGKGWSDNDVYPSEASLEKEGTFMSRNEQLGAIDKDLDINNYELVYGKGYEAKPEQENEQETEEEPVTIVDEPDPTPENNENQQNG